MNILPKKSWHVRNKNNIERVRRDEAEAERLNNIEQDRRLRAEQEARVAELRARAGIVEDPSTSGHINLFERPQDHQSDSNKEHEEEKRREEARWEERNGILNRLVRSEDVNRPWYCRPKLGNDGEQAGKPRSTRITSIYDPLIAIKQAEEIVKAKRLEQKKLEISNESTKTTTTTSSNPSSGSMIAMVEKGLQVARLKAPVTTNDDSSPEIIKIVRSSRANKLKPTSGDSKQHKDEKSKRKDKKRHKKCKHHHHHHHHHHRHHKSNKHKKHSSR